MKNPTTRQTRPLSVKELMAVRFTWILSCQQERFHKEIQTLKKSPNTKARLPLIRQLQLYLDKVDIFVATAGFRMPHQVKALGSHSYYHRNIH